MLLYNSHKDEVINVTSITVSGDDTINTVPDGLFITPPISDSIVLDPVTDRNELITRGYYPVVRNEIPNRIWYSFKRETALVDSVYTITYIPIDKPIDTVKERITSEIEYNYNRSIDAIVDTVLPMDIDTWNLLIEQSGTCGSLSEIDLDECAIFKSNRDASGLSTIEYIGYLNTIQKSLLDLVTVCKTERTSKLNALAVCKTVSDCIAFTNSDGDELLVDNRVFTSISIPDTSLPKISATNRISIGAVGTTSDEIALKSKPIIDGLVFTGNENTTFNISNGTVDLFLPAENTRVIGDIIATDKTTFKYIDVEGTVISSLIDSVKLNQRFDGTEWVTIKSLPKITIQRLYVNTEGKYFIHIVNTIFSDLERTVVNNISMVPETYDGLVHIYDMILRTDCYNLNSTRCKIIRIK